MTVNVWLFVFSKTNPARTLQPISSNCTLIHKSRYVDRIFDAIQSNNVELFSRLNLYKPKKRFYFFPEEYKWILLEIVLHLMIIDIRFYKLLATMLHVLLMPMQLEIVDHQEEQQQQN